MNPLNYLRQATACISKTLPTIAETAPEYASKAKQLLAECAKSRKFLLPEGGRIFDDNLRGLPDVLRLPFPQIVIEYRASQGESVAEQMFGEEGTHPVPKRVIYAQEVDGWIDVVCICGTDDGDWYLLPWFVALKKKEEGEIVGDSDLSGKVSNSVPIPSVVTQFFLFGEIGKDVPNWGLRAQADTNDEANTVMSLIEALSCINVTHDALPARKQNKSGKRRGALPFDEYRVLTIKPSSTKDSGDSSGTGRSPREHLRRGHIRRLDDKRRVWVNACVVNPGTQGKITSDYRVKS